MRIYMDIDQECYERLAACAIEERRPLAWQAEVLLRRALGLSSAWSPDPPARARVEAPEGSHA